MNNKCKTIEIGKGLNRLTRSDVLSYDLDSFPRENIR